MNSQIFCIGHCDLSRSLLERHARKNKRLNLRVIGRLNLHADVTPELVRATLHKVTVRGTMTGPDDALAAVRELMR